MEQIGPFTKLPEYPFVFCNPCGHACIADEVQTHLRRHHRVIDKKERANIIQAVKSIPGIIHNQTQLRQHPLPVEPIDPVPIIARPRPDGLRCDECPYIIRGEKHMRDHAIHEHKWKNDRKQGDSCRRKTHQAERTVPWTSGVYCQRFFPSRAGSAYFEVRRPSHKPEPEPEPEEQDIMQRIKQLHSTQEQRFKEAEKDDRIEEVNQKFEANAWLGRVGWSVHLNGLDRNALWAMARPVEDEEGVLRQVCDSLDRTMEWARSLCRPSKVGSAALFEINRREVRKKPARPFDGRMEDDSWIRYKEAWRKIISIWYRTQQQEDEDERPPYKFTTGQQAAWNSFIRDARTRHDAIQGNIEAAKSMPTDEAMDQQCLEMVMLFLDHQVGDNEHRNAIISALAVLGIREDGGWCDPSDYTPVLSAVIKVARMFAIGWAYRQREEDVQLDMKKYNIVERLARERVPGMFPRVRKMVHKFMTRVGDGRSEQPGPMDWILETRTYGMHIRFNTTAGGSIDWKGDQVQYKRTKFTMRQLTEMIHAVVGKARELLCKLTMVDSSEEGLSKLPHIPWDRLEDDNSEDKVGYSFLEDSRNTWLEQGKGWVFTRIVKCEKLRKEWISNDEKQKHPYKKKALQEYSKLLRQLLELIWFLMHLLSMPARLWEILGLRFKNTSNGGTRNIFIHNGDVCFVTAYHKNFQQTGQAKIIHRFIPREVGELLVWYLWLVLPFWQQVQGMVKGADQVSAFLWSEEIVYRKRHHNSDEDEGYSSDEEDEGEFGEEKGDREEISDRKSSAQPRSSQTSRSGQSSQSGQLEDEGIDMSIPVEWKNWIPERKWTPDRARRILQQISQRLMGCRLNISVWRHIAIAISNRYLGGKYIKRVGEEGIEYEDEDGIDDDAADLQAGHGSHVAGIIYARELQQGLGGTARMREEFRKISHELHRFVGFGIGAKAQCGQKRKRDQFESEREEGRFRRLRRLQQVDIHGQLQQMMGRGTEFRGQQSNVIRAIIAGETPIIQITSTGGGKSLSFMLPAYCSTEGTTIVVVPLVALQEDLHKRCTEYQITSHIWNSRQGTPTASIVFVTPESAVTGGFRDYINRLQNQGVLDRVILEECHTLMDGSATFRPKLSEVGRVVREWGVQRVFLTATLGPDEMAEFYKVAAIQPGRAVVFRSKTTRHNIRYSVIKVEHRSKKARGKGRRNWKQEEEEAQMAEDKKIKEVVEAWIGQGHDGKVIIYGGTVERVKRLGEMFGCGTYYNKVDTKEGKKERLQTWMMGERIMVATNALGMGIDIRDVRLVVHAWMPRRIRDYVQESGRAGRDGQVSEAVIICRQLMQDKEEANRWEKAGAHSEKGEREQRSVDYVEKEECRRKILDMAMDGRTDRESCEEGEEKCDICRGVDEELDRGVEDEDNDEDEDGYREARMVFDKQRRDMAFQEWQNRKQIMEEAAMASELEGYLESWAGRCAICRMGDEDDEHRMEDCPLRQTKGYAEVVEFTKRIEEKMFRKGGFERYSGCFGCGLPYQVCNGWKVMDDDGGRYEKVQGVECQYKGLLAWFYGAACCVFKEEMVRLSGQEVRSIEFFRWAGRRIGSWGGMETNEMCRGFVRLCKWMMDEEIEER